jgi:hypothetical protein
VPRTSASRHSTHSTQLKLLDGSDHASSLNASSYTPLSIRAPLEAEEQCNATDHAQIVQECSSLQEGDTKEHELHNQPLTLASPSQYKEARAAEHQQELVPVPVPVSGLSRVSQKMSAWGTAAAVAAELSLEAAQQSESTAFQAHLETAKCNASVAFWAGSVQAQRERHICIVKAVEALKKHINCMHEREQLRSKVSVPLC